MRPNRAAGIKAQKKIKQCYEIEETDSIDY